MSELFTNPASSTGIQWDALHGALLLITVKGNRTGIQTAFGDADAVEADVAVLDGDSKGDTFADALIFPKVLQGQLRSNVGTRVLGRLGQGEKKAGQSAPWKLSDPTDADRKTATDYLANTEIKAPF
jgi:hypothetical protein